MPGDFTDGNGELWTAHIVLTSHRTDEYVSELLMLAGWKFSQALFCVKKMWMRLRCLCMTTSQNYLTFVIRHVRMHLWLLVHATCQRRA